MSLASVFLLGTVRKELNINFLGVTREANQIYIVDARLEGLEGGSVSKHFDPSFTFPNNLDIRSHILGVTTRKLCTFAT